MKLEAFLCPMLHNMAILVWTVSKFDHTIEKTLVAYTGEVNKKGKPQEIVEPTDDAKRSLTSRGNNAHIC